MTPEPSPLHVERSGSGAPVVLLHSSGLSGRQWKRLASTLTALMPGRLRTVVPDLTGHGASPALIEPRPLSFRDDVDHTLAILEAEGAPVHLVGHSYGGLVAIQAALRAPSSVRSLVLYDPVAFGALDPVADQPALQELASLDLTWGPGEADRERWLKAFVNYWGGGDAAWGALREEARAEFRRVGWACREGVRSLLEDTTPAESYRAIPAPALLLTGALTPIAARSVVRRLGESLPHASTVIVPGAGHMGPLTHADAVNAAILDFIARA
jgi:pimeloyl-ACP methyl ester carboxylesterase